MQGRSMQQQQTQGLGQKKKKFAYLPWKIGAEPATRRSFDFDMRTFVNLNLELALLVPCACVSLALRIFCAAAPKWEFNKF